MKSRDKSDQQLPVLLATGDAAPKDRVLEISSEYDFLVVISGSCKKVLEYLLFNSYDLVIIDPALQGLDGPNMVESIKEKPSQTASGHRQSRSFHAVGR